MNDEKVISRMIHGVENLEDKTSGVQSEVKVLGVQSEARGLGFHDSPIFIKGEGFRREHEGMILTNGGYTFYIDEVSKKSNVIRIFPFATDYYETVPMEEFDSSNKIFKILC